MGTLNPDIVDALNMLLEDERASVEIEVALSNGATEFLEREALTSMGVEDTLFSFLLRDWLESHKLPVTRRINGIVLQALDLNRYDDRLLLFLQHQNAAREQAEQILAETDETDETDEGAENDEEDDQDEGEQDEGEQDDDVRAILRSIVAAHVRHAAWSEQRASEFAETRQFEFRRPPPSGSVGSTGAAEGDTPPDPPGERSAPRASTHRLSAQRPADDEDDVDDERRDNDEGASDDALGEPEHTSL